MSAVKCEACGDELPALARRNRRYCDARCRRRAYEERHVPALELPASTAAPEHQLAPVVPIGDEAHVQELLARVLAEERLVAQVAAGAKTQWRAAAWILERRYAERWGPPRPAAEPDAAAVLDDEFSELDQLAAKRRAQARRPRE